MTIEHDLLKIKALSEHALNKINMSPEKTQIADLIILLKQFDSNYKSFCSEMDRESLGDYDGDCYENGVDIEYEIEAGWWHEISLIVRNL